MRRLSVRFRQWPSPKCLGVTACCHIVALTLPAHHAGLCRVWLLHIKAPLTRPTARLPLLRAGWGAVLGLASGSWWSLTQREPQATTRGTSPVPAGASNPTVVTPSVPGERQPATAGLGRAQPRRADQPSSVGAWARTAARAPQSVGAFRADGRIRYSPTFPKRPRS